jgi:hypothetical protein
MKTKITIFIIIAVCVSCFLPAVSLSERSSEVKKERGWKDLIKSDIEKERILSKQQVLNERKDTIDFLLSVVSSPVKEGEEFYTSNTSRNMAISLLGTYRAKEAVKALTQLLIPKEGQSTVVDETPTYSPAGYALVEIGLPSVLPVIDRLKQGLKQEEYIYSYIFFNECVKVIVGIMNVPETECLLESEIAKEKDAGKKANLQKALDFMKEPTMHSWLEDMYKRVNEQK